MSVPRVIEMVFGADCFSEPPTVGSFYASKSGQSALSISKVRRVVGDTSGPRYRLIGLRVKLCDLPDGVTPLPWPKRIKLASSAAMVPGPAVARPRVSPAQERVEQRRRVVALLRDDRDSNRVVHSVRIANKTAVTSDWRDPDDLSPNRRTARVVHGYRGRDSVQTLLDNGTITKGHMHAARRFRREYELGEIGLRPCRNLAEAPNQGASPTGPSETRLMHLETFQATAYALGPHLLGAVLAIVIHDHTIQSYAASRKLHNRQNAAGYVLAALDMLRDYYKQLDDDRRRMDEAVGASA